MAEIKNSSVDMLVRQMPDNRKKDEKTADGPSGFKIMLKNKNQKKDSENTEPKEAKEPGNQTEGTAVDAAAILAAAEAVKAQKPEAMLPLMGQELIQKPAEGSSLTDKVQGVMPEKGEKVQIIDPFHTLNQMKFQNLTKNSEQKPAFKENVVTAVLQGTAEKTPDTGLEDKTTVLGKANQKEVPDQKDFLGLEFLRQSDQTGPGQKGVENNLKGLQFQGISEKMPVRKESETESSIPAQKAKSEKTPVLAEKDEKNLEKGPGIVRENAYVPDHHLHISSKKGEATYTTVNVNAQTLEDLDTKLSQQILKQIHAGRGDLEVQLEPHNLGKIQIKIAYEDHQVSVSVLCSESKTLKLLSQSAGELGSILENNLERPVQILIDKQGTDYLNQQKDQSSGQEHHQPQQENKKEENREDFVQKLRLGIFETGNPEDSERE